MPVPALPAPLVVVVPAELFVDLADPLPVHVGAACGGERRRNDPLRVLVPRLLVLRVHDDRLDHRAGAHLERPSGAPDARSPHAASGRGIDWFERDGWVSGHIPGLRGGFLLPRSMILDHPWIAPIAPAA